MAQQIDNSDSLRQKFSVIDLFAGVGGMSLGAARAGFDIAAAAELDPIAIATHTVNFPKANHLNWDVSKVTGDELLKAAKLDGRRLDGLIGGPPCQGFSDMGKRDPQDPRNNLFSDFFRLVSEIRPRFFLAENVPGILADRNRSVVEAALRLIPADYIVLPIRQVAASDMGAPTSRPRVFFFGYDPGSVGHISADELFKVEREAVTVGAALAGLPQVRSSWQSAEQGWRVVKGLDQSDPFYARLVGHIPAGVGCAESIACLRDKKLVSGNLGTIHSPEVTARFSLVPQGGTDKISRAPRLKADGLCPTLRAGTASDRGSFQAVRPIHHRHARVISPREAARLQGFPDWFQFHPTKWHSFRQIGNSVSPLLAEAILKRVRSLM
ncbi:DNA cytosine methyltransferase [Stenotrophomonas maltophilia]|nr:DNA cytosine methyltransferase [Stenotrophomonas maltophilia]